MPEKSKNASHIKHPRHAHARTRTHTRMHAHMYTHMYAHTCTHVCTYTCTHTQARDRPQTHVLSVAASDPHPSTQGVSCSLIVKNPELDKPCNKFSWKRRGRESAKNSKDELEISSLWPSQEFPKSTGLVTANLWAYNPALFDCGCYILALKKARDSPSIWGKKTKAQAHKSHLSV